MSEPTITAIQTPAAPAAIGPYAQAIEASGQRFLFLSGQIALDPETGLMKDGSVAEEIAQVLANLGAVLAAAGANATNIVKATILLTDMADFGLVNEAYAAFMGEHRPARAAFAVAALPKGARVEIEAIAVL
jgi:2-iminobutanoate/2-iminopropanoate deaminase